MAKKLVRMTWLLVKHARLRRKCWPTWKRTILILKKIGQATRNMVRKYRLGLISLTWETKKARELNEEKAIERHEKRKSKKPEVHPKKEKVTSTPNAYDYPKVDGKEMTSDQKRSIVRRCVLF